MSSDCPLIVGSPSDSLLSLSEGKSTDPLVDDTELRTGDELTVNDGESLGMEDDKNGRVNDTPELKVIDTLDEVSSESFINAVPGRIVNLLGEVNLLKIKVLVNEIPVMGVLDTGAAKSLISECLIEKCNLNCLSKSSSMDAIGGGFNLLGSCTASIIIQGIEMPDVPLLIYPTTVNTELVLILGVDFLTLNGIEIQIPERKMIKYYSDGGFVEIQVDESGMSKQAMFHDVQCFAAEDHHVKKDKAECIPVYYTPHVNSEMVLYCDTGMSPDLQSRLSGISGIFDIEQKRVLVISSETDTCVKKGQALGSLSSIVIFPDEETDSLPLTNMTDEQLQEKIALPELTIDEQCTVQNMLKQYKSVFSMGDADVGQANVTEHKIKLYDSSPIYQRPRRFPQPITEEIERQCHELNALDIIEPSMSPWSSPVVPIRKKDGTVRLCIDYRKLNKVTIPDKFPVPNLSDSIFGLHNTKFFTSLDLVRGYYQIPIDKESRECTAFSTPKNHWQFKRLSFGLRNAPSAFQRQIQSVLNSFPSNKVIVYIDDILIMGTSFDEHLSLVSKVLSTLQSYNIKIKPPKCEWFRSQVEYLGHIVSCSGIKKTAAYLERVDSYPKPQTVGELRAFLGIINFQRKFLPRCSELQKPLSCLTGGKKNKRLDWTPDMTDSFNKLKTEMRQDIELAYPDYGDSASKLELWVDASARGAGAYLAQLQEGSHRVIGFASMTFTPTQINYSTMERELTALRWGIKTFRPFLYGVEFLLYTDHQPLVHLHNMRLVCSRLARTLEELSEYIFDIIYVPGHLNTAADALSRLSTKMPLPPIDTCQDIPEGLTLDGPPASGGGDSLFVSVYRVLSRLKTCDNLPGTEMELREKLVDDLLMNSQLYNLKLDKKSRKELRLMRCRGQLPALEVLMSTSRLFKVKIFVYYWSSQPVVYKFDDYTHVMHLQCLSGIHFNPLIELMNYVTPDESTCTVVEMGDVSIVEPPKINDYTIDEGSDVDTEEMKALLTIDTIESCNHLYCPQPHIYVVIGNRRFCVVLDTGAMVSLISMQVVDFLNDIGVVDITNERFCDIVGMAGDKVPISQTVRISFDIGSFSMAKDYKFGVVPHGTMPHCILLGLDFFNDHGMAIDLKHQTLKQNDRRITGLVPEDLFASLKASILLTDAVSTSSHKLIIDHNENGLQFEIEGDSSTVTGLSLLLDHDTIHHVQSRSSELQKVKRNLINEVPTRDWTGSAKPFVRHISKLKVENNVLVYCSPAPVVVVTYLLLIELLLMLHYKFAHVGRDKLLDLLFNLIWHPSKYKVANDISTTYQCQLFKG